MATFQINCDLRSTKRRGLVGTKETRKVDKSMDLNITKAEALYCFNKVI